MAIVSSPVPQIPEVPGATISVKNTFLVAEELDDDEMTLARAARRRTVQSCPIDICALLAEPAPEPSPGKTDANDDELQELEISSPCKRREASNVLSRVHWASMEIDHQALWPDDREPQLEPLVGSSELMLLHRLMDRTAVSPLKLTRPPPRANFLSMTECMPDDSPSARTLVKVPPVKVSRAARRRRQKCVHKADADATALVDANIELQASCANGREWNDERDENDERDDCLADDSLLVAVFEPLDAKVLADAPRRRTRAERQRRCVRDEATEVTALSAASREINTHADVDANDRLAMFPERCEPSKRGASRTWCHIYLDEKMLSPCFDLVQKLIGRGGCNTRAIFEATGTKVRIRGRGSGHYEQGRKAEADAHLMIALTAERGRTNEFCKAFEMTRDLAERFAKQFDAHSGKRCDAGRFWLGGTSEDVPQLLGPIINSMPHAKDTRTAKSSTRRRG
jgi:hypothetical protein